MKYLKMAKGYIGWYFVNITVKMKIFVQILMEIFCYFEQMFFLKILGAIIYVERI